MTPAPWSPNRGDASQSGDTALHTAHAAVADIAAISRCPGGGRRVKSTATAKFPRMAPIPGAAGYSPAARVRP